MQAAIPMRASEGELKLFEPERDKNAKFISVSKTASEININIRQIRQIEVEMNSRQLNE